MLIKYTKLQSDYYCFRKLKKKYTYKIIKPFKNKHHDDKHSYKNSFKIIFVIIKHDKIHL